MESLSFKLDTGKWRTDTRLSMCSPSTRGVWFELICQMHAGDKSGELTGTVESLARIARCKPSEMQAAIDELDQTGTASVSRDGNQISITCRRIRREYIKQHRVNELRGEWPSIRANVLRRDMSVCGYCGSVATAVDHIIPRSQCGTSDPSNLVAACKTCNSKKGGRTLEQARMRIIYRGGKKIS